MFNIIIRRAVAATAGAGIALTLMAAPASAAPRADGGEGQGAPSTRSEEAHSNNESSNYGGKNDCPAEEDPSRSDTGNGANQGNTYDDTCEAEHEPGNGSETGKATGQPCAGCVGNADDKNPKGQNPDWSGRSPEGGADHNKGYECDGNQGIGQENPAHTSCNPSSDESVDGDGDSDGNGNGSNGGSASAPAAGVDGSVNEPTVPGGNGTPNAVAPEAVKCGEVMATDVNGDGTIDAADCTKVLGVQFERAPAPVAAPAVAANGASGRRGAQVLGVQFGQAPAALVRTGATFAPLVLAALVLILSGFLMVHGRRRSSNS